MKAAYYDHYGAPEVVEIREIAQPVPGDHEVLVRVVATAVTAADVRLRAARFPRGFGILGRLALGIRRPRGHVLGGCFSGIVEAVGSRVDTVKPGDEVCGMNGVKMGAHAEYIVVNATKSLALKPAGISHEDAAGMLFGGTTALSFLRDQAGVKSGDTVLVNGASGAVGTNAVQIAKHLGASVTGVTSGGNVDLMHSLGADRVIDYTKQHIAEGGDRYDVVFDAVGTIHIQDGLKLLTPEGRLVLIVASLGELIQAGFRSQLKAGTASEKGSDIELLLDLMQQNKLTTVIDSTYTLDDIAAAHARVDSGHKTGNVIVKVG